jgi:uncharacterized protein YbbK (DUF523 family)
LESKKIMVSACLLGINCRYNGESKFSPQLVACLANHTVIPCCPELLGELMIPRPPAEIINGDGQAVWSGQARVIDRDGNDRTAYFKAGAQKALELYLKEQPEMVIFKANSPSCGRGLIYNGSFNGELVEGDGVATTLLRDWGATIYTEEEFLKLRIIDQNKF